MPLGWSLLCRRGQGIPAWDSQEGAWSISVERRGTQGHNSGQRETSCRKQSSFQLRSLKMWWRKIKQSHRTKVIGPFIRGKLFLWKGQQICRENKQNCSQILSCSFLSAEGRRGGSTCLDPGVQASPYRLSYGAFDLRLLLQATLNPQKIKLCLEFQDRYIPKTWDLNRIMF